jgi:hypothetical protein
LWAVFGPAMTFYVGAGIAGISLFGLLVKK